MHRSQFFRAGVGAMIIDRQGLVLALERADTPAAWQLPQGGLDPGEEPLTAARREAEEETGLPGTELELLDSFPEPLAYELPAVFRSEKTGRGQVQYWFLFRFSGDDSAIDVERGGEFRAWRWLTFAELIAVTAGFRQALYQRLATRFREHLASPG